MRGATAEPPAEGPLSPAHASPRAAGLSLTDQPFPPGPGSERHQLAFEPRRRFPGRHRVRGRLQQLGHQALGPVALPLEVRPVTARRPHEPQRASYLSRIAELAICG